MVDHFKDSLAPHCFAGQPVPPGLFWCLAPDVVAADQLGGDGHPKLEASCQKFPMKGACGLADGWNFMQFAIGDEVQKTSRIDDITFKSGRSGNLALSRLCMNFL